MLTRLFVRSFRPGHRFAALPAAWVAVSVAALGLAGCSKVPLLAPSGSTIALSAPVTVLPVNGSTQITAEVISSGGQAVHDGTTVTFTSNLGSFQPAADAQTKNGRATVTFVAGSQSGVASITATSGAANLGASSSGGSGTSGSTASTPNSLSIKIGGAAASAISLNANPAVVPASGGSSVITATVVDTSGNPLPGVPVTFVTTAGTLSASTAQTDSSGQATVTLTTSVEAKVSASAGTVGAGGTNAAAAASVTVEASASPTATIAVSSTAPSTNQATNFTVVVEPGTGSTGTNVAGAAIASATINFGDGTIQSLGSLTTTSSGVTIAHTYTTAKTYVVTLTVTDVNGQTIQVSTPVTVSDPAAFSVTVTLPSSPAHGATASFSATASLPSGVSAQSYKWTFTNSSGTVIDTITNTGNSVSEVFPSAGTYTVTVTVTGSDGSTGTATSQIAVS